MTNKEKGWLKYFFEFAILASTRSTCLRRRVGAVLVRDRRIIATGYNGAPSGVTSCDELNTCLRDERGIPSGERHELCRAQGSHAESNAITQCALHGVSAKGADMYCTTAPCGLCVAIAINSGVRHIHYLEGYFNPTVNILTDGHVNFSLTRYDPKELGLDFQGSAILRSS